MSAIGECSECEVIGICKRLIFCSLSLRHEYDVVHAILRVCMWLLGFVTPLKRSSSGGANISNKIS